MPARVDRLALDPEALAEGGLVIQDPDADGEGPDFVLIREKPVAPELRHVDQITGRIGDLPG